MTQQARPKPSIPLTADAFADHQETAVYWLASPTILLNSYGTNILMDPTLMFLHDDDQESMVSEVLDDDQIDYMKFLVRPPILASVLPRLAAVLLTSSGELRALILIGSVIIVGAIGVRIIFKKPHHPEPPKTVTEDQNHEEV